MMDDGEWTIVVADACSGHQPSSIRHVIGQSFRPGERESSQKRNNRWPMAILPVILAPSIELIGSAQRLLGTDAEGTWN